MAKRITELDALTGSLANTDLFVMVDSAQNANAESKSVKYETLRDSIGSSVTNTAIASAAYTSSNTTFNFNRQDGGTVTLNFNPSINACSDVDISSISTGQIMNWSGTTFLPMTLDVASLENASTTNVTDKDILVYNQTATEFQPTSHSEYLASANVNMHGDFVEPASISDGAPVVYNAHVSSITGASQTNPVRLTVSESTLPSGEQVTLTNVGGMTQINNNNYYVQRISATQYDLYSDSGLTTAVNGLGYTGYTSGGEMSAQTFRSYGPRYAPNTILQVQSYILPGNVTYGVTNTYTDGPATHRKEFTPKSSNSTILYRLTGWLGAGTSSGTNIQGQTGRNLGLILYDYSANQIIDANSYDVASSGYLNVPHAPQVNWRAYDGAGGTHSAEFIIANSSTTMMNMGLQVATGGTTTESYVVWGNDAKAQSEHNMNVSLLTLTITEIQN
tara:strand:- start:818 stop:2161 length:1344 start_codon:yes stop_codon:yes gene_type:complete